jgi:glycosyltransferase involved in cell wall biosynthesis
LTKNINVTQQQILNTLLPFIFESMNMAPIALFCYNRLDHLKATIESLKENKEAAISSLYIFVDGPKDQADAIKVDQVKQYLATVEGFAAIIIRQSTANKGLAPSIIAGVSEVLKQHQRVVVMEDDLLCTTDFLSYINAALDFYESNSKIGSLSGYLYPISIPAHYSHEVLVMHRASSLGWATWRNRWEGVDWEVATFKDFLNDKEAQKRLVTDGLDLLPMLIKQRRGLISSWAIRWTYHHFISHQWCLYPVVSKIQHIGSDSSGTNVSTTSKYDVVLSDKAISFTSDLQTDPFILRNLRSHQGPSWIRKLINYYKFRINPFLRPQ